MRRLPTAVLVLSCAATNSVLAETVANAGLFTDYLFRGISQTHEGAAVQGGLDWSNDSGFYLGTWLSNTDFNPPGQENSGVEVDLYGGYTFDVGPVSLNTGFISYQYPSIDGHIEELLVGLGIGGFAATFYHDPDNDTDYLSAGYDWALDRDITLSLGGGTFDSAGFDYTHYQFSVSKPFRDFEWSLTLSDTDIQGDDVTLVLGVSTELSF